ncbi:MAG: zinc metalloprotease, partial [Alphaproteobacteria bacterium]|nr:zinc metalloprotease [Alphaproteobacteria bacterium]
CAEVEGDDQIPFLRRELVDLRHMLHAGIVDEDVDRSELVRHLGHHRFDRFGFGEVGIAVDGVAAALMLEPGALPLHCGGIAETVDDEIRPLRGERLGDGEADAGGGAGDEGVLAFEEHRLWALGWRRSPPFEPEAPFCNRGIGDALRQHQRGERDMRLGDYRESDNVEDQRGQSFGGGGGFGGGGFGGLLFGLVLSRFGIGGVLVLLLGYCALSTLGSGGSLGVGGPGAAVAPQQVSRAAGGTSACNVDAASRFSCQVLASTEDTWSQLLAKKGEHYTPPRFVFYGGEGQSGCGVAQSAMGPFYCPTDHKIYLDTSFYGELSSRFGATGDFAQAYVIAHEVGHHIQFLSGTLAQVERQQQAASTKQGNALQVRVELQADCLAGVWAANAKDAQGRPLLEPGDAEEGLRAASAIGDDRLQQEAQGTVVPDSFTHGSSAQRTAWLKKGLDSGDPAACDTSAGS